MILVCAIVPALILCLTILYAVLVRRFFIVKTKLPVLGVRGALGRTAGKRRKLAVLGTLFFVVCLAAQLAASVWSPGMLMVFNYEEAARGQNPNVTRFNESNILSEGILEQVIQRGGPGAQRRAAVSMPKHFHPSGRGEAGCQPGVGPENLHRVPCSLF